MLTAAPAHIREDQHTLIRQCQAGEPAAFRSLYTQHARAMYNTAFRLLNNHADSEDVLQEAFTDAFRNLHRFNFNFTFGTWLKKIVVNKCINQLRRRKAYTVPFGKKTPEPAAEPGTDEMLHTTRVEAIRQGIAELPDAYRAVLSLYLFEDYSQEEVAEMLGISHGNVRIQYMRGKQKLIDILKKQGIYG